MVDIRGNATTGYAGNGPEHVALPRPVMTRVSHRPWCVDCKTKHDATDLDDAGRCARCARAAVSRAEADARRAERADEIAALEKAAQTAVATAARKSATVVRRAAVTTPKLPAERKQGKPTSRTNAPAQAPTSSTTGRAPEAGRSTTQEKSAPPASTAAVHRTQPAGGNRDLDAQVDHATRLLRATRDHTHPLVATARRAAVAALEALHLAHELNQPAAPTAPSPAVEPAPTTSAGPRGGEPQARRPTTHGKAVDEHAIVTEYQAGDSSPTIAKRHGIQSKRVRNILDRHGIARRDDRTTHSGGRNRLELPADQVDSIRRRYVDDHATIDDLAADTGVHRRIITRHLVEAGVTIRPPAHRTGTVLTDAMAAEIADRYAAGASIHQLCRTYRLRNDRVRDAIRAAGHTVRPKGASSRNSERMATLGTTAREIKTWAVETGRATHITSGLVPASLIDAWEQEHQQHDTTTNPTGALTA